MINTFSKMFSYRIFQDLKTRALIHVELPAQYHTSNCPSDKKVTDRGTYKSKKQPTGQTENTDGMEESINIQQGWNVGVSGCA